MARPPSPPFQPSERPPRPLTSRDVADLFGADISAVSRWASEGLLPHFRTPAGQLRFHWLEIEPLLASSGGGSTIVLERAGVTVRVNIVVAVGAWGDDPTAGLEKAIQRGLDRWAKDREQRG